MISAVSAAVNRFLRFRSFVALWGGGAPAAEAARQRGWRAPRRAEGSPQRVVPAPHCVVPLAGSRRCTAARATPVRRTASLDRARATGARRIASSRRRTCDTGPPHRVVAPPRVRHRPVGSRRRVISMRRHSVLSRRSDIAGDAASSPCAVGPFGWDEGAFRCAAGMDRRRRTARRPLQFVRSDRVVCCGNKQLILRMARFSFVAT
jgi:hypothetical protein